MQTWSCTDRLCKYKCPELGENTTRQQLNESTATNLRVGWLIGVQLDTNPMEIAGDVSGVEKVEKEQQQQQQQGWRDVSDRWDAS